MQRKVVLFGGPSERLELARPLIENHVLGLADFTSYVSGKVNAEDVVLIWIELEPIPIEIDLTQLTSLRAVFTSTTGLDHIDLNLLQDLGLPLFSLNTFEHIKNQISSTSELTWGLIISVYRRLFLNLFHLQEDAPIHSIRERYPTEQLRGKTLGIVGFGRIGSELARYGVAFGMKVLFFDPYIVDVHEENSSEICSVSLNEVLSRSNIVAICASKASNRVPIIGKTELELMNKSSIIVNTARGSLWDEKAVADALSEARISGVGVDVYRYEELSEETQGSPLLELDATTLNIIATPHIGGATIDALQIVTTLMAKEIYTFLSGEFDD